MYSCKIRLHAKHVLRAMIYHLKVAAKTVVANKIDNASWPTDDEVNLWIVASLGMVLEKSIELYT